LAALTCVTLLASNAGAQNYSTTVSYVSAYGTDFGLG